jgi:hypothetical protein
MPNITIDAAQLQMLLVTVKSQNEALERSKRSESQRQREEAARAESRQRQHSLSIAAALTSGIGDAPTKLRGTPPMRTLAVLPPPNVKAKHRTPIGSVWRAASRIAVPITRTLTSTPCYFVSRNPSAKRS